MTAREILEGWRVYFTDATIRRDAYGPLLAETRAYLDGPSKSEEALIKAGQEWARTKRKDSISGIAARDNLIKTALALPLPSKTEGE